DTGFGFVLSDSFSAVQWEGFGDGETKLETFKRALERYKAEFRIVGNTVYLESQIGRDTSIMYRHRLNASNIVQEIDAKEMWTYAKGYGDYDSGDDGGWENAGLEREYTSPLAGILGIRHAPPIKNGNITDKSTMDSQLKTLVDESLKISVSADIHDLRNQGYPIAQSEVGDRVFLIDERIGLNDEVRVISQSITRNWRGDVIDLNVTFGSEGIAKRHQSNISTAVKDIKDLLDGKKVLPYSVLDDAVKNATKALRDAQTELTFSDNGILAVDKNDPNLVTLFNSAGLGVSNDGGNTFENAITGEGINASTIYTGTMLADRIAGGVLSSLNGNTEFNLNDGHLRMDNTEFLLGGGADIEFLDPSNKLVYQKYDDVDGFNRTAGFGVSNALNNRFPVAFIGTVGTGKSGFSMSDANYFTGFIANTNKREVSDGIGNSVVGYTFHVREIALSYDKGFTFTLRGSSPTLRGMNSHLYEYTLGESLNRFNELYVNNISGVSDGQIVFKYHTDATRYGYVMETTYPGDRNPSFRPRYGADEYHNLGTSSHVWRFGYINTLVDLSTKDEKHIIKNADVINAVNFVDTSRVKEFMYIKDDITDSSNKRLGLIYEEIEDAFSVIKGDADNINLTNVVYYLLLALQ